jgi:XTP/dITP diphosphohydrolase
MKLIVATRNRKKIEEIGRILGGSGFELLGLDACPDCPEVEEDADTFEGNAVKKAVTIARWTGAAALADDSGLVVDALGGAPGVYSARYAGAGAGDADNVRKLLAALGDTPAEGRTARFVCVMALAWPDGRVRTFEGRVEGRIGREPRGENGFGYDPVFIPEGRYRTFAEMSAAEKDAMSHRGRAIEKLRAAVLNATAL